MKKKSDTWIEWILMELEEANVPDQYWFLDLDHNHLPDVKAGGGVLLDWATNLRVPGMDVAMKDASLEINDIMAWRETFRPNLLLREARLESIEEAIYRLLEELAVAEEEVKAQPWNTTEEMEEISAARGFLVSRLFQLDNVDRPRLDADMRSAYEEYEGFIEDSDSDRYEVMHDYWVSKETKLRQMLAKGISKKKGWAMLSHLDKRLKAKQITAEWYYHMSMLVVDQFVSLAKWAMMDKVAARKDPKLAWESKFNSLRNFRKACRAKAKADDRTWRDIPSSNFTLEVLEVDTDSCMPSTNRFCAHVEDFLDFKCGVEKFAHHNGLSLEEAYDRLTD